MRPWPVVPVAVLLWGDPAEACKCAVEPTVAEAVAMADAVFVGTVVDQRAVVHMHGVCTGPAVEYDLVVHRAWKGGVDLRLSLRRVSPCSAAFDVGTTWLLYATRAHDRFVVAGCLPNLPIDQAAGALAQLAAPTATFPGAAPPVAPSLPISRWLRAHAVAGFGIYANRYADSGAMSPSWDMIAFPAAAGLLAAAAAVGLVRRRCRGAAWLLAGGVLTLAGHVFWIGRVFLQDEWNEAFLRW